MPNIKIGSKTFEDVENINLPLADGTGQASFGTGGSQEKIEWHQCPEVVRKFVEEVAYDLDNYSVSCIADYAPSSPVVSNYKPVGKTVGSKTFYNEIPNVETPYQTDGKYGTAKPLDQVRYINTPVASNVRDLGGWACDGGTVKYGLLYRGGEPTYKDRAVLVDELGIRHDLNLRGSTEATWDTSPLGEDVYFTKADAYNWYSLSNIDAWATNLRCVVDAVTHNEPVLFHCAAGADRTGTLACILEGLLGMSQSDIDKDYELTCFASGTGTDNQARRRNEAEWKGLINAINAKDGESFRDKCVTFALELGFTDDEINTYRKAMIDGEPEVLNPVIETCAVQTSLEDGILIDNLESSVSKYQPYIANLECADGSVIKNVKVLCGGKDITSDAWSGTITNLERGVKLQLTGCNIDNTRRRVIDGQSYAATITALSNYKINNVTLTMGGEDVSKYYSNGVIAIPRVTGDIEIIVEAEAETTEPTATEVPLAWKEGYTCSYTVGQSYNATASADYAVSEVIPITQGATYAITLSDDAPSGTSFKFVGADDSGIITEVQGYIHYSTTGLTFTWTPSEGTTQMRIRTYSTAKPYIEKLICDVGGGN